MKNSEQLIQEVHQQLKQLNKIVDGKPIHSWWRDSKYIMAFAAILAAVVPLTGGTISGIQGHYNLKLNVKLQEQLQQDMISETYLKQAIDRSVDPGYRESILGFLLYRFKEGTPEKEWAKEEKMKLDKVLELERDNKKLSLKLKEANIIQKVKIDKTLKAFEVTESLPLLDKEKLSKDLKKSVKEIENLIERQNIFNEHLEKARVIAGLFNTQSQKLTESIATADEPIIVNFFSLSEKLEQAIMNSIQLLKSFKAISANLDESRLIVIMIADLEAEVAMVNSKKMAVLSNAVHIPNFTNEQVDKLSKISQMLEEMHLPNELSGVRKIMALINEAIDIYQKGF